jgi:NRPS condensation-like uncharacterized protein
MAAHAQLQLTLDNPIVQPITPFSTYIVTGVITNESTNIAASITSDSLAGPDDLSTGNPSTNATYTDLFLNYIGTNGPISIAPLASSPDMQLVQVTVGAANTATVGYYTVNDDNQGISSNTAPFAENTAAPEFSTMAMMMTGGSGLLLQLARRRTRKSA